ncbi:MAG: hypothetical protein ACE5G0_18625 [Rhodothermales bacterium]
MNRIKTLSSVFLFALALLIAACGGYNEGESQADADDETTEHADEPMEGDMDMPEAVTVAGTLVDTKCYGMNHANTGDEHMTPSGQMPACATACANMGIPVGVLEGGEQDAKVYVLLASAAQLSGHMAKEARVTGMPVYESGLIPEKVEVKNDAGEWEEVTVAAMM